MIHGTEWRERFHLCADIISLGGAVFGAIQLILRKGLGVMALQAFQSWIRLRKFYRAMERYADLRYVGHLRNNISAMLGQMSIWFGGGLFAVLSGLIAFNINPTGRAGGIVAAGLYLGCILSGSVTILDAFTTGLKLRDYENFRDKTLEKIRKVAPEFADGFETMPDSSSNAVRSYTHSETNAG